MDWPQYFINCAKREYVPSTTDGQKRYVQIFDEFHALSVPLGTEIETAQPIAVQWIGAALKNNRSRLVQIHHVLNHRFEHLKQTKNGYVNENPSCTGKSYCGITSGAPGNN